MNEKEKDNNPEKESQSKRKKLLIASIALLTGFSGAVVGSSIIAYNSLFKRYERPNYLLTPGNYCYERVSARLPREEVFFYSNKERLKGYHYQAQNSKGLIVLSHGYHAGADDYLPIIEYFTQKNFSVFAFDMTGTYDSDGNSTIGWCQALIDLDYALRYVKSEPKLQGQPLFLIGHSMGGYAVTSVLSIHRDIKAVAAIAPMRDGSTMLFEKGEQYVGDVANLPKPIIDAYQKLLFGDYTEYNAIRGINSTEIPIIVAHGVNDSVITFEEQSVTARRHQIINPNVKFINCYGIQGEHCELWHSLSSIIYQQEIDQRLLLLEDQMGNKLPDEQMIEFFNHVNHDLYSEVNPDLMSEIFQTFESALT